MSLPVIGGGGNWGSVLVGGTQPWNQIIWPPTDSNAPFSTQFMSPTQAKSLPVVGRVIGLTAGMIKQMPIENSDGVNFLTKPAFFKQPDPDQARSWWVGVQVEDYLLNGNAVHYVTVQDTYGFPLAAVWVPADWVTLTTDPVDKTVRYWVGGIELDRRRVIHVKRGADRVFPYRGVGLVEQHMRDLCRVDDQSRYERSLLTGSAVPSVAVIAPNPDLSQDEADDAQEAFIEKYGGDGRRPGVFPAGTQIIPLAWSPADAELNEARKQSLIDVANMANMDGFWVGAPSGSFTYKSPGPMYLNLIRQTLNPILEDFEGVWSIRWVPRGREVRFNRTVLLQDDMETMVQTAAAAVAAKLWTQAEARMYLGYSGDVPAELKPKPVPPALAAANDQQQQDQQQQQDSGQSADQTAGGQ